jgi:hypothetical protein
MYLEIDFDKFSRDHKLEVRSMLHFLYEGDGDMSVRVFDDSSYRWNYHDNESGEDIVNIDDEDQL